MADLVCSVYDGWINLPYAEGEVSPDPTVSARFGNTAYDGGRPGARR